MLACIASLPLIIVLIIRSETGLSVLEAMGTVILGLICAYFIIRAMTHFISYFYKVAPALITMVVLVLVGLAIWRYVDIGSWPKWLRLGFSVGVAVGVGASVVLAAIQLSQGIFISVYEAFMMRKFPEADFVQTALSAMLLIERAGSDRESDRTEIVFNVENLAQFLASGIVSVLSRVDPPSAPVVITALTARAEALRARKKAVLFSQPDALDELLRELDSSLLPAARRQWLALREDQSEGVPKESRRTQVARIVGRTLLLAVPVTFAIFAWVKDQPGLVSFATLWVVISVVDLVTPGGGTKLADSAAQADKISFLRRNS